MSAPTSSRYPYFQDAQYNLVSITTTSEAPESFYKRNPILEEIERKAKILSQSIEVTWKSNAAFKIKFSSYEVLSFLNSQLNRAQIQAIPYIIGGAASHILAQTDYADIDICFYFQNEHNEIERKQIFDFIAMSINEFIFRKFNESKQSIDFNFIDSNCFRKKICINNNEDAFSLICLGDLELKFIFKKPRHNVFTIDGFQIDLDGNVRCIDVDTFCNEEQFNESITTLQNRSLILHKPATVTGLPFRFIHKITQGYVSGHNNLFSDALKDFRKDLNPALFREQFIKHQENHYPNSKIGEACDFLNWIFFINHIDDVAERNSYLKVLTNAWFSKQNKHFQLCAKFIKDDPDYAKNLVNLFQGILFFAWLQGQNNIIAYPKIDNNGSNRSYISIFDNGKTHYLFLNRPDELIINCIASYKLLREISNEFDRLGSNSLFSLDDFFADIGLQHPSEPISFTETLISSLETEPIRSIITAQFQNISLTAFYSGLRKILNPTENTFVDLVEINSNFKRMIQEPLIDSDKALIISLITCFKLKNDEASVTKLLKASELIEKNKIDDPVAKKWVTQATVFIIKNILCNHQFILFEPAHKLLTSFQSLYKESEVQKHLEILIFTTNSFLKNSEDNIQKYPDDKIKLAITFLFGLTLIKGKGVNTWSSKCCEIVFQFKDLLGDPTISQQIEFLLSELFKKAESFEVEQLIAFGTLWIELLKVNPNLTDAFSKDLLDLSKLLAIQSNHTCKQLSLKITARLQLNSKNPEVLAHTKKSLLTSLGSYFIKLKDAKLLKNPVLALLEAINCDKNDIEIIKGINFENDLAKAFSCCLKIIAKEDFAHAYNLFLKVKDQSHSNSLGLTEALTELMDQTLKLHESSFLAFKLWNANTGLFLSSINCLSKEVKKQYCQLIITLFNRFLEANDNLVISSLLKHLMQVAVHLKSQDPEIIKELKLESVIEKSLESKNTYQLAEEFFEIIQSILDSETNLNLNSKLLSIHTAEGNTEKIVKYFPKVIKAKCDDSILKSIEQLINSQNESYTEIALDSLFICLSNKINDQNLLVNLFLEIISRLLKTKNYSKIVEIFKKLIKFEYTPEQSKKVCVYVSQLLTDISKEKEFNSDELIELLELKNVHIALIKCDVNTRNNLVGLLLQLDKNAVSNSFLQIAIEIVEGNPLDPEIPLKAIIKAGMNDDSHSVKESITFIRKLLDKQIYNHVILRLFFQILSSSKDDGYYAYASSLLITLEQYNLTPEDKQAILSYGILYVSSLCTEYISEEIIYRYFNLIDVLLHQYSLTKEELAKPLGQQTAQSILQVFSTFAIVNWMPFIKEIIENCEVQDQRKAAEKIFLGLFKIIYLFTKHEPTALVLINKSKFDEAFSLFEFIFKKLELNLLSFKDKKTIIVLMHLLIMIVPDFNSIMKCHDLFFNDILCKIPLDEITEKNLSVELKRIVWDILAAIISSQHQYDANSEKLIKTIKWGKKFFTKEIALVCVQTYHKMKLANPALTEKELNKVALDVIKEFEHSYTPSAARYITNVLIKYFLSFNDIASPAYLLIKSNNFFQPHVGDDTPIAQIENEKKVIFNLLIPKIIESFNNKSIVVKDYPVLTDCITCNYWFLVENYNEQLKTIIALIVRNGLDHLELFERLVEFVHFFHTKTFFQNYEQQEKELNGLLLLKCEKMLKHVPVVQETLGSQPAQAKAMNERIEIFFTIILDMLLISELNLDKSLRKPFLLSIRMLISLIVKNLIKSVKDLNIKNSINLICLSPLINYFRIYDEEEPDVRVSRDKIELVYNINQFFVTYLEELMKSYHEIQKNKVKFEPIFKRFLNILPMYKKFEPKVADHIVSQLKLMIKILKDDEMNLALDNCFKGNVPIPFMEVDIEASKKIAALKKIRDLETASSNQVLFGSVSEVLSMNRNLRGIMGDLDNSLENLNIDAGDLVLPCFIQNVSAPAPTPTQESKEQ